MRLRFFLLLLLYSARCVCVWCSSIKRLWYTQLEHGALHLTIARLHGINRRACPTDYKYAHFYFCIHAFNESRLNYCKSRSTRSTPSSADVSVLCISRLYNRWRRAEMKMIFVSVNSEYVVCVWRGDHSKTTERGNWWFVGSAQESSAFTSDIMVLTISFVFISPCNDR